MLDGAERAVLVLGEAAQSVEVAEQLVGAVDEMNDHLEPDRSSNTQSPGAISNGLSVATPSKTS